MYFLVCFKRLTQKLLTVYVISGFRREVAENYTILGDYSASSTDLSPTFRDNLPVPSSGFKNP